MRFGGEGKRRPVVHPHPGCKAVGKFLPRTRISLRNLAAVKGLSALALWGQVVPASELTRNGAYKADV